MNTVTHVGVEIIDILRSALERMTPERYRVPAVDAPCAGTFLGFATEYQKALYSLSQIAEEEHDALHEVTGLPYGGNIGLPLSHRALHVLVGFSTGLLEEDLANTYVELDEMPFVIDREWKIYCVSSESLAQCTCETTGQ